MTSFEMIIQKASDHYGGIKNVEEMMALAQENENIQNIADDRWLSAMTKCIFQAGFKWQLIEDKWEKFEEVFENFQISRWAMMSDEDIDHLLKEKGIVRHYQKIKSVGDNAIFLNNIAAEYGSAGDYFSAWTLEKYSSNLQNMQKRTSRLGGKTGQLFLRRMGMDTLVFTHDVLQALSRENILNQKIPTSKKKWAELQECLNKWHDETKYGLNEISQILALSNGPSY